MTDSDPVGVLGGTFDPIHLAHLRLAEEARQALGLEEIRLIPAGDPPHRPPPAVAAEQRLRMVELAVDDNRFFTVDQSEIVAADKSYTVVTLERLRAHYGKRRPLVLILGADAFLGIPEWHDWQRLLELAHIAVANRPGFDLGAQCMSSSFAADLDIICRRHLNPDKAELASSPGGHIFTFEMTPLAISASLIRNLLRTGRSIRYLVPVAVLDYIEQNHLYR